MPLEKFRDEVGRAVVFANVVDGEDVWMVQRGDGAGFLLEAAEAVGVFRKSLREDFDGDVAAEAGVFCTEDFAHSASADWRDNFVWAEFSAASECHRVSSFNWSRPRHHGRRLNSEVHAQAVHPE